MSLDVRGLTKDFPTRSRPLAVVRALSHKPAIGLADEPTGNLDRTSAKRVGELLLALCRDEGTILLAVTHSAELGSTFPRTRVMDDGRLQGGTGGDTRISPEA